MVTRSSPEGSPVGPSQTISASDALGVYTAGSAEATDEQHHKGRLVPGQLADFAVLDADPRAVDPAGIGQISVQATYVGGVPVHES